MNKRSIEEREISDRSSMRGSRDMETRDKIRRNILMSNYSSPLHFDKSEVPDGFRYEWFRYTCLGQEDRTRIPAMQKLGWMTVPPERHPDKVSADPTGKIDISKGYIECGGVVLYEREEEFCKLEDEMRAKKNYDLLLQMPSVENGNAAIPFQSHGATYIMKTASVNQGNEFGAD